MCDAVLQRDGSARLLTELERANLFLVPLDERRAWYRFHQLSRDLLAHELSLAEPDSVAELHHRAFRWHVAEGLVPEAIRHAGAAGDYAAAAELIAANWLTYVNRGRLETVEAWAGALPGHITPSPILGCAWPAPGCCSFWGGRERWSER